MLSPMLTTTKMLVQLVGRAIHQGAALTTQPKDETGESTELYPARSAYRAAATKASQKYLENIHQSIWQPKIWKSGNSPS